MAPRPHRQMVAVAATLHTSHTSHTSHVFCVRGMVRSMGLSTHGRLVSHVCKHHWSHASIDCRARPMASRAWHVRHVWHEQHTWVACHAWAPATPSGPWDESRATARRRGLMHASSRGSPRWPRAAATMSAARCMTVAPLAHRRSFLRSGSVAQLARPSSCLRDLPFPPSRCPLRRPPFRVLNDDRSVSGPGRLIIRQFDGAVGGPARYARRQPPCRRWTADERRPE